MSLELTAAGCVHDGHQLGTQIVYELIYETWSWHELYLYHPRCDSVIQSTLLVSILQDFMTFEQTQCVHDVGGKLGFIASFIAFLWLISTYTPYLVTIFFVIVLLVWHSMCRIQKESSFVSRSRISRQRCFIKTYRLLIRCLLLVLPSHNRKPTLLFFYDLILIKIFWGFWQTNRGLGCIHVICRPYAVWGRWLRNILLFVSFLKVCGRRNRRSRDKKMRYQVWDPV